MTNTKQRLRKKAASKKDAADEVPMSAFDDDESIATVRRAAGDEDLDDDIARAFDFEDDDTDDDEDDSDERGADERAKAVDVVRAFRGDERLILTYLRTSPNPYKEDDADTIEIYADDRGFEYWIDPQGDVLVQAGPSARVHPTPRKTRDEDRRSVGELRSAAVAMICTQIEGFAAKRSSYHPLEDNRHRETYFFRWDDFSQPAKESELPPFVQVGLHADGTLASYTNTLRRAP